MRDRIKEYFNSVGIEYFSVLDYRDTREINSRLMERAGFTPRSAIMFLLPYYAGETENISRYAASLDYHTVLRKITDGLIEVIGEICPEASARGYGDHSPIDERHAALISGLGILGDSGLIINEKYGSYVFVGECITDIEPDALGATPPTPPKQCSHCGACRRACPTGILRTEGSECLSAITQKKGELTEEEIALMRRYNTVWGCDLCQTSCPHNREPITTPVQYFYEKRIQKLTSDALSAMSDEEFSARAFSWRGRGVCARNLRALDL